MMGEKSGLGSHLYFLTFEKEPGSLGEWRGPCGSSWGLGLGVSQQILTGRRSRNGRRGTNGVGADEQGIGVWLLRPQARLSAPFSLSRYVD